MTKVSQTLPAKKRVSRSINFDTAVLAKLKKHAEKDKRSVSGMVNLILQKELGIES